MSTECASCHNPLTVELEHEEDGGDVEMQGSSEKAPDIVPDDCRLSCGCHFHWLDFLALSLSSIELIVTKAMPSRCVQCP